MIDNQAVFSDDPNRTHADHVIQLFYYDVNSQVTVEDLYLAFRRRFAKDLLDATARTGSPFAVITQWSKE